MTAATPPANLRTVIPDNEQPARAPASPRAGAARAWPAPWVFGVLILPLGVYTGFVWTPLPFLLGQAGVSVDRIARIESLLYLPPLLMYLWTPVVDIKLRRRTWLVLSAAATGLCVWAACLVLGGSRLGLLTALLLVGGCVVALSMASCGGLMVTTLTPEAQAKASAWNQAGQLGGGAVAAAIVMWLAVRAPGMVVGLVAAALLALPALLALAVSEPAPAPSPWFRGRLAEIWRAARALVRTPRRRWSVLLLVSPAGVGAAQALLPAIASHYGVGASGVAWTNALAGGGVLALGSLATVLIPSSWSRQLTYVGAALANGLAALVLLAGNTPAIYVVGTLLYLVTQGLCWARFVALAMEVIGGEQRDAGTWYTLLIACGALPQTYMTWLDGLGWKTFGTHGLLWTDSGANLLVFTATALAFLATGLRGRSASRRAPVAGA